MVGVCTIDGMFFGRADYQDIAQRFATKTMKMVWKASANLGQNESYNLEGEVMLKDDLLQIVRAGFSPVFCQMVIVHQLDFATIYPAMMILSWSVLSFEII